MRTSKHFCPFQPCHSGAGSRSEAVLVRLATRAAPLSAGRTDCCHLHHNGGALSSHLHAEAPLSDRQRCSLMCNKAAVEPATSRFPASKVLLSAF